MTIKMVSVAVIVCMQLAFDVTNHFLKSDCLVYKLLVSLAFTSKSYQVTVPPPTPEYLSGEGGRGMCHSVSQTLDPFQIPVIHTYFQSKMANKP